MLSKQDLTNLKDIIGDVVDEKLKQRLGENFSERIDKIERNTDAACKIAKDADEELTVTQAKVDRHDTEIKELQSFTGFVIA